MEYVEQAAGDMERTQKQFVRLMQIHFSGFAPETASVERRLYPGDKREEGRERERYAVVRA